MKNVTLSMPEDLIEKSRRYAQANGTSMNELIRELLRRTVEKSDDSFIEGLKKAQENIKIDTRIKISRNELYDR